MPVSEQETRFNTFFKEPLYLLYKNNLYNFLVRRSVVRKCFEPATDGRYLELGCGISPMLPHEAAAVRTDLSHEALKLLASDHRTGVRSLVSTATELPFLEGSFDSVVCSEVLEHVENDQKALDEIFRVLKSGGAFILTCPVCPELYGFDDEFVGHYRRYDISGLLQALQERGFEHVETRPVLGTMEKFLTEKVVRFFAWMQKGKSKPPSGEWLKMIFWIAFPCYILINYVLALFISFQARISPLSRVVTLCVHCRKPASN